MSPRLLALCLCLAHCGCGEPQASTVERHPLPPDMHIYPLDFPAPPDGLVAPVKDRGGDAPRKDAKPPPGVKCASSTLVRLQEMATGQPDYVTLKNVGSATVSLAGYRLEMNGIGPESFTFPSGSSVGVGKVLYVVEHQSGQTGDVMTNGNIPFYDSSEANSVALWDAAGNLLDFVSVGSTIGLPAGVTSQALTWPASFDPQVSSFQRVGTTGTCPSFPASNWSVKPITRP